ncbi:Uncharacterised protein at_DN2225 [Pycnogonum litorale]
MIMDDQQDVNSVHQFKCDRFGLHFKLNKNLEEHMKSYDSNSKQKICKVCLKSFINASDLIEHIFKHLFCCDFCSESFPSQRLLTKHHRMHTSYESFRCEICNLSFTEYYDCRKHFLSSHSNFRSIAQNDSNEQSLESEVIDSNVSEANDELSNSICVADEANIKENEPVSVQNEIQKVDNLLTEKIAKNEHDLIVHNCKRASEKLLKCHLCSKSFNRATEMKKHYHLKHADVQLLECNTCSKTFFDSETLQDHFKQHNILHDCDVCGKSFQKKVNLNKHYRIHTGEMRFKCKFCDLKFTYCSLMKKHVLSTHHDAKRIVCEVCHQQFLYAWDLTKHMSIKHNSINKYNKSYECHICSKVHKGHIALKNHIRKDHPEFRPLVCDFCEEYFLDSYDLKKHASTHKSKVLECKLCEMHFVTLQDRRLHVKNDHGEKPFVCNLCAKTFVESSELEIHWKTHMMEKPFMCDICGLKFKDNHVLKEHKMTHTGERPFKCEFCDKSFIQSGSLNTHKRTHTLEKPYLCDICGHRSSFRSGMRRHRRTHTGERPYECQFCNKKFGSAGEKLRHARRLHTLEKQRKCEKTSVCELCGKGFTQLGNLKMHLKKIHWKNESDGLTSTLNSRAVGGCPSDPSVTLSSAVCSSLSFYQNDESNTHASDIINL